MNKNEAIEKIADCLCNRLHNIGYNSCKNKNPKTCAYCREAPILWSLSKKASRDTAKEVLKILDYDGLPTLIKPVFDGDEWKCGNCGHRETIFSHFDYCPHCGKKIDWKAYDETYKYSY